MDWHRLFGLLLIDFFAGSPFEVELEKDLSIKQQYLDVVIVRRGKGRGTHTQRQERFEVLGFGSGEPLFPVLDCSAGDSQVLGQALLGQSDGGSQGHKSGSSNFLVKPT